MFKLLASYQTVGGDTGAGWPGCCRCQDLELGGVVKVGAGSVHRCHGKLGFDASRSDAKSFALAYTQGSVEAYHRLRRYQPYQQRRSNVACSLGGGAPYDTGEAQTHLRCGPAPHLQSSPDDHKQNRCLRAPFFRTRPAS